jgi:serine/threonine-protein kinase
LNTLTTIPGYEFLQNLEESDTATLWRARQESLERDVTIRILKPEFICNPDEVQAFLREVRAVAKLKSGNLIQVYDVGQHEDALFIVMESVNGQPLTTLLDLGDPLPQKRALSIALSVAQALSDAWNAEKLIHRNIKPKNIMIEKGGAVKVANLGMSAINGDEPGIIVGTPNYMSPEQANASGAVDFTSDMYSLGALLYHMVTGQVPFDNLDEDAVLQGQINGQLPFPQDLNPDISPPCAQVIARLMMKDPQKRYPDWQGVINDLAKLAAGKMIVTKPMAGPGSTIAIKGGAVRNAIKVPAPKKKIIARPPGSELTLPAAAGSAMGAITAPSPEETAARAAALKKKYGKPTTPIWIKLPLIAALMVLFGWLGMTLLWQPYREAFPSVAVPAPDQEKPEPLPEPPRQAQRPSPRTPPSVQQAEPPVRSEPQDDYVAEPARPPLAEPLAATPASTPAPETSSPRLNELKTRLVTISMTEGLDTAAKALRQQQDIPGTAELAGYFAPANQPEIIIADAFKALVGKETYVNMGGRRVDFRVEGVSGETISTMVKVSSAGAAIYRPADLKISQLPIEEQRRWLGEPKTPEKAFAAALLDFSTANYTELAKQAGKCGAMADATRAFAQQRIAMLLE